MKVDLLLSVPDGALAAVADVARVAEDADFDGVSYSEIRRSCAPDLIDDYADTGFVVLIKIGVRRWVRPTTKSAAVETGG